MRNRRILLLLVITLMAALPLEVKGYFVSPYNNGDTITPTSCPISWSETSGNNCVGVHSRSSCSVSLSYKSGCECGNYSVTVNGKSYSVTYKTEWITQDNIEAWFKELPANCGSTNQGNYGYSSCTKQPNGYYKCTSGCSRCNTSIPQPKVVTEDCYCVTGNTARCEYRKSDKDNSGWTKMSDKSYCEPKQLHCCKQTVNGVTTYNPGYCSGDSIMDDNYCKTYCYYSNNGNYASDYEIMTQGEAVDKRRKYYGLTCPTEKCYSKRNSSGKILEKKNFVKPDSDDWIEGCEEPITETESQKYCYGNGTTLALSTKVTWAFPEELKSSQKKYNRFDEVLKEEDCKVQKHCYGDGKTPELSTVALWRFWGELSDYQRDYYTEFKEVTREEDCELPKHCYGDGETLAQSKITVWKSPGELTYNERKNYKMFSNIKKAEDCIAHYNPKTCNADSTKNKVNKTTDVCDGTENAKVSWEECINPYYKATYNNNYSVNFDFDDGKSSNGILTLKSGVGFGYTVTIDSKSNVSCNFDEKSWNEAMDYQTNYANIIAKQVTICNKYRVNSQEYQMNNCRVILSNYNEVLNAIAELKEYKKDKNDSTKCSKKSLDDNSTVSLTFDNKTTNLVKNGNLYMPQETILNRKNGLLASNSTQQEDKVNGGNKIYPDDIEIVSGDYPISVNVSINEFVSLVNNKCSVKYYDTELQYRLININNPFINDKYIKENGIVNWKGKYDFTATIPNGSDYDKTYVLSNESIKTIQATNTKEKYLGTCMYKNNRDAAYEILCK